LSRKKPEGSKNGTGTETGTVNRDFWAGLGGASRSVYSGLSPTRGPPSNGRKSSNHILENKALQEALVGNSGAERRGIRQKEKQNAMVSGCVDECSIHGCDIAIIGHEKAACKPSQHALGGQEEDREVRTEVNVRNKKGGCYV